MDKQYFLKLLDKHLKGKASKEEQNFLISYYDLYQSEEEVLKLWTEEKKELLKEEIRTSVWQNIYNYEKPIARIRTINRFTRVAAAAIFIVICSSVFFYWYTPPAKVKIDQRIAHKVVENRKIYLPDGSTVVLSAGSKLHYPSSFDSAGTRDVYLEGEAFFDIMHNASKPFIVHSGKVITTVLGTAFNIKAFPAEISITVTVIRGKVQVRDQTKLLGIITPHQQIVYNKQDGRSLQAVVPIEPYMDWQKQNLLLDNVTVGEAAGLLEQRFNVRIVFTSDVIKSKRFTTTLIEGETLEQALKLICEFNEAAYRYDATNSSLITIDDQPQNN